MKSLFQVQKFLEHWGVPTVTLQRTKNTSLLDQ